MPFAVYCLLKHVTRCVHLQVQGRLQEQQERAQAAETSAEALKKENANLKGVSSKLKNAQKEIDRLHAAWTDKDVQLAEANIAVNSQRHVRALNMSWGLSGVLGIECAILHATSMSRMQTLDHAVACSQTLCSLLYPLHLQLIMSCMA